MVERTKDALGKHGFGVLTEIDVRNTMRKKLDADVGDYLILGACTPSMALEAMKVEPKVGAMLPCKARETQAAKVAIPRHRRMSAAYIDTLR